MAQVRVGWRAYVGPASGTDADAQSFVAAAGIADSTQISAINTLVADLKAYGLWTKMKAIYPFVGGSAASHKWNLKDPRDLDAAYRLVFSGGWTHTSNGAKPNGTTGYANTYLTPNSNLTLNNVHLSYYSRTNILTTQQDMGAGDNRNSFPSLVLETYRDFSSTQKGIFWSYNGGYGTDSAYGNSTNVNSLGFYVGSRISANSNKFYKNSSAIGSNTATSLGMQPLYPIWIGGQNYMNTLYAPSARESGFASIGDGLTDTEASNFYISVQKFQTTLGRHVGTPYVSDADAIAFLTAAGITDGTQAAAINTLVIRMKADGVWTKMKAVYPFVGGTAFSHKFNLKDPRDLDAAFRLVFIGGWTHTSNGAKGNGTTGYADTKLIPSSNYPTSYDMAFGFYSRTDIMENSNDISAYNSSAQCIGIDTRWSDGKIYGYIYRDATPYNIVVPNSSSAGLISLTRTSTTMMKIFRDTSILGTTTTTMSGTIPNTSIRISGSAGGSYSTREKSFTYIGNGLSDAEINSLYSAVQAYQTTLGRQVNVPLVSDTDAQAFLNAANITSFQQASAVNKLVVDLKAAGVWTKMKAIYPFVGGSAASHKFNLKDPRDLDAAYRLVFNGGGTHGPNGYLGNGSNSFARTYITHNTLSQNNTHVSFYNRYNSTSNYNNFIGCIDYPGTSNGIGIYPTNQNNFYMLVNSIESLVNIGHTSVNKFWMINRNSSTQEKVFINGSLSATINKNSQIGTSKEIYLGSINGYGNAGINESSFASIGDGLTDAEATAFYTAVQTYQTSLGRSVDTPIYNNGLVLNLDAGNANSYPGTGTTWFDLASGNNGTLVNGPTYDTTNGGSLYFDGTNKYTDISYTKINITNKLTISSWVYFLSQPSTTGNPNIVDKWDWPNNKRSFHIGTENGYLATSISYDGLFDNRIVCSDNSSIVLNQWINITMTYDGRTLKLYKNGSLIQSSSFSQDRNIFSDITTNIFLGRSRGTEGSSRHLNVRISGVQIYSNSLTATEILNNFNSTRGRFGI